MSHPAVLFVFVGIISISTLLGGLLAMRCKQALQPIIGFSAGVLIATAFADLLPEVFELIPAGDYSVRTVMVVVVAGFLLFHCLEKFTLWHACREEDRHFGRHQNVGILGAMGLSLHSFFDGVAIGVAFHSSYQAGIVVSTAVALHKFSDGVSMVSIMALKHNSLASSLLWLAVNGAVPLLGALSTFAFTMSDASLGLLLAFFAGLFLYIGASDLLPEAHRDNTSGVTTLLATVGGIGFVFLLIHLFHG